MTAHTSELKNKNLNDVVSPSAIVKERPDLFTSGRIDWFIRQRSSNGLAEAGAVLQVGRRIYLMKSKFIEWFLAHHS